MQMEALNNICEFFLYDGTKIQNKFTNETIFDVMRDMAPVTGDVMVQCAWKYEQKSCKKLFVPVFTDDGFCFAFNALNSHEIYTEE